MSGPRRIVMMQLTCPSCEKRARTLLMENSQGICKMHSWLCPDCGVLMDFEVLKPGTFLPKCWLRCEQTFKCRNPRSVYFGDSCSKRCTRNEDSKQS